MAPTALDAVDASSAEDGLGGFVSGRPMYRADDCCAEDTGTLSHNQIFFAKVCFVPGTTQVKSLAFVDGG